MNEVALLEAAADLGRLRRRLVDDAYSRLLVDRIAGALETLMLALQPTAAELAREGFRICGDHELAAELALEQVDAEARHWRELLRLPVEDDDAIERAINSEQRAA